MKEAPQETADSEWEQGEQQETGEVEADAAAEEEGKYADEETAENEEKNGEYNPDEEEYENSFGIDEGGNRGVPGWMLAFLVFGTIGGIAILMLWSKGAVNFSILRRYNYEQL